MAQTSVPTALLSSADLLTEPSGVTLDAEIVTDVTSNPIESDVGSNTEISRTGASSLVDAVDDTNTAKFFQVYNDLLGVADDRGSVVAVTAFSGQTLSDPSVDTDHKILLLLKRNGDPPNGTESVIFALYSSSDLANPVYFNEIKTLITQDVFALIEIALSAPEVQDFRSKGGYLAGPGFYLSISGATADPPTEDFTQTYDVAYIALEVPDSGPPGPEPDIEIVGSGGLVFNSSDVMEGGLVFSGGGVFTLNMITGDGGFAFGGGDVFFFNNIVGDGGFVFGGGGRFVLSVDASGLYTIIPSKRQDTLYQRNDEELTEDVAIPRPFYRTAYVGG